MKVMQIISKIREIDAKSKGLDNPNTPPGELMKELIFYILHWFGTLKSTEKAFSANAFLVRHSPCIKGYWPIPAPSKLAYFEPSRPVLQNLREMPRTQIFRAPEFGIHII